MAKSGTSSSVVGRDSSRSAGTRTRLIDAAIETLKAEGFAGSSARAIAERAGLNQGLIFYHFGSVANLLLAALDSVSARRMEQYGAAIDRGADHPPSSSTWRRPSSGRISTPATSPSSSR